MPPENHGVEEQEQERQDEELEGHGFLSFDDEKLFAFGHVAKCDTAEFLARSQSHVLAHLGHQELSPCAPGVCASLMLVTKFYVHRD